MPAASKPAQRVHRIKVCVHGQPLLACHECKRTTPKKAKKPRRGSGEKVYRIKPIKWKYGPSVGVWSSDFPFLIDPIRQLGHVITFRGDRYECIYTAKAAAESWYRQQLRKALVEVKS